jgi:hypothetical protein
MSEFNKNNSMGQPHQRYGSTNYSGYNQDSYARNKFNEVYEQVNNQQLSVKLEPEIQYDERIYYITACSKMRDTSKFPNVNRYDIILDSELKNIKSIELIQAIIPYVSKIEEEPYLLLKIDEIDEVMMSNDTNINETFAILQMSSPVTHENKGFVQIDKRIHEQTIKYYKTPKASLHKLSISITDADGVLFNFAHTPSSVAKADQTTFVFRVICLEKKQTSLNQRNLYLNL